MSDPVPSPTSASPILARPLLSFSSRRALSSGLLSLVFSGTSLKVPPGQISAGFLGAVLLSFLSRISRALRAQSAARMSDALRSAINEVSCP